MALPPVLWKPSPYHWQGRGGQPIRIWVDHRVVGWLNGMRAAFGVRAGTPRNASSTFGIGHDPERGGGARCPSCGPITGAIGQLVVDQYVDLADSAWANGDVREPTSSIVRSLPGVNPNLYSISVEHEDGGSAGGGRVTPHVWEASMALTKLVTSGNLTAIRNAGIRVSDRPGKTAAQLVAEIARIPETTAGYIDHHQIAGPNKPYCWRPWLQDPGFIPARRAALLATLTGAAAAEENEDMSIPLRRKAQVWTFGQSQPVYAYPNTAAPKIATLAGGLGVTIAEHAWRQADGSWTSGPWRLIVLHDDTAGWVHRNHMQPFSEGAAAFERLNRHTLFETDTAKVPVPPLTGSATTEQLAAARAEGAKAGAKAAAADVADGAADRAAKYT